MPATSEIHTTECRNGEEQKRVEGQTDKIPFSLFCDERGYLNQIEYILQHGHKKGDRTGTGVVSVFGSQARYSLRGKQPVASQYATPFSLHVDILVKGLA